jgi:membrane protein implicated in regulation of membrane protease activity
MGLILLVLLVILAITGALWAIVKIALAVALGLVAGVVVLTWLGVWRVRRALYGPRRDRRGRSRVTIIRHDER